ncbi:MAG TPA: 6-carboxytetrahydropterin synthase [Caldithrix abyssi]|uniref:6-carboxy-5,6,7,8-tetrahydropterin synthase n=1 Tax=Caldithrix abyssi TaxID=187145 RepID=A0A7V4U130_CALAY|nr:6-carboxytetrahydropterin synthase [Caldithrix abyssi]
MKNITISKKFEFSASHRYWRDEWCEEENRRYFGNSTGPYGHGHNYELHVTVLGNIDPKTGMIINLTELKKYVNDVLESFDHKFLNLDTPYFKDKQPTTENLALVLFDLIAKKLKTLQGIALYKLRLYEKRDLYVDVWQDKS